MEGTSAFKLSFVYFPQTLRKDLFNDA
jgi:hypothetical protein